MNSPFQDEACSAGSSGSLITVEVAAGKAVALARPVQETERVRLVEAHGRILAGDLKATLDLPPFDTSAMDGYAVRLEDLRGDGPWILPIGARLAAGDSASVRSADPVALRIFTGAAVPAGFDAVVMQERCTRIGDRIRIAERPRGDQNIRRGGEDVARGAAILEAGKMLAPADLALLAAQSISEAVVFRKVRVGLVSTGSELVEPGSPLRHGQIFNSNRVMLSAMLSAWPWVEIIDFGIVPDAEDLLSQGFARATRDCDVLISTGGVPAGEEDHVVSAFRRGGGELALLKVAMRPGKPVKVGIIGEMLFVGLPGNPNATLVTFLHIARPALKAAAGASRIWPEWVPAVTVSGFDKKPGRTEFVPARIVGRDEIGRPLLELLGRGSSASLGALSRADGMVRLSPALSTVAAGLPLEFEPFSV